VPELPQLLASARFYLELHLADSSDAIDAYFMECQGFKTSQEIIDIYEVTPQMWGKDGKSRGRIIQTKIPGNLSCTNLTLKRGLTVSSTLWDWLEAVQQGAWATQRRDGSLTLYDQGANAQFRFEFKRAWPVSYSISDVSVSSGDLEIEELEVAVEELRRVKVV
jgi:phage tail-like protein